MAQDDPFVFPSICGSFPPQSCIFSQVLNMGAALGVPGGSPSYFLLPSPPSRVDLHYPLPPAAGLGRRKVA
ncbi:hypothetical protein H8959_005680 [Pygathrix nigripes]